MLQGNEGDQQWKSMSTQMHVDEAIALMQGYAERTGLVTNLVGDKKPSVRYLWTDAFAVCNYLGLARTTGVHAYNERARELVNQVHHTLGRHRTDDERNGWISGLSEHEGELLPTSCGLRIGKPMPERGPKEPVDERLEWSRDGQYFHYLTKWMHALDQVSRTTQQPQYNVWSRELSKSAFNAFTYEPNISPNRGGSPPRRMVWKMSIDLSRAQVTSMGQHDPLDGYVTNLQLSSTYGQPSAGPTLSTETEIYKAMIKADGLHSTDPLGLGGMMIDAYRLHQLMQQGNAVDKKLIVHLLTASLSGLHHYRRTGDLQEPAQYRLAFRELGLAIGLHAIEAMQKSVAAGPQAMSPSPSQKELLKAIMVDFRSVRVDIEACWRNPKHHHSRTWKEHQDINEVMLATCLCPNGVLDLSGPGVPPCEQSSSTTTTTL